MRVGFVIGASQVGGAERQVVQLAQALRGLDVESVILVMERPRKRRTGSLDFAEIPYEHLWVSRWLPGWGMHRLRRLSARFRLDLLHFYHVDAIGLARAWRDVSRPVLVGSLRGLLFAVDQRIAASLRQNVASLDAMTANCEAIRAEFRRVVPEFDSPIEVLPNVVMPRERKSEFGGDGRLRVLFVGSLKAVKDPLMLVRAAQLLAQRGQAVELTMIGSGPLESEIRRMGEGQVEGLRIRLPGAMPAERIPYQEHDVVVSASLREGSSNSLLEALASGVPVVATAVGGSIELVESSQGGLLVPAGNAEAMADALEKLRRDRASMQRMGSSGHDAVREFHDPGQVARRHLEFYEALIDERPGMAD